MSVIARLNKFIIGTTRGRDRVKKIRLSENMYEQYRYELFMMGYDVSGRIYFMGVEIVK